MQVHLLDNGEIVVFSRNSENMSAKYPDLIESVPKVQRSAAGAFNMKVLNLIIPFHSGSDRMSNLS
jgi:hypothetical protein